MLDPTTTFALNLRVNKIVMVTKPKIFDTIPKWSSWRRSTKRANFDFEQWTTLGVIFDLNMHREIDQWQAHISKMLPYDMIRQHLVQSLTNLEFESCQVTWMVPFH